MTNGPTSAGHSPWYERRGERHHNAKLTAAKVRKMRELHAAGWSYKRLAAKYDVGEATIGKIVTRRAWRDVE